ncbi:hypothetical protein EVAR_85418_1 [Eumeta japonica]|uniref:Uncharacterized protein n=1 Tax=Eumeta variegata TaxID=151549 RepID=A0A4C1WM29_EUMVA|nr:hypothetical protein EVAR_85418_1 [Eumeta japonica]
MGRQAQRKVEIGTKNRYHRSGKGGRKCRLSRGPARGRRCARRRENAEKIYDPAGAGDGGVLKIRPGPGSR